MKAGVRLSANGVILNTSQTFHDKVERQTDRAENNKRHNQQVPNHSVCAQLLAEIGR
jgi:hypothetical protein